MRSPTASTPASAHNHGVSCRRVIPHTVIPLRPTRTGTFGGPNAVNVPPATV
jgi:hypothetical protein